MGRPLKLCSEANGLEYYGYHVKLILHCTQLFRSMTVGARGLIQT